MSLFSWVEAGIHTFRWFDISLIKLSVFMFSLLLVKLWPPVASLNWCIYLGLGLLAAIRPMYMMLRKNKTT